MTTSTARLTRWVVAAIAVALLGTGFWAGGHMYHVHDESWQWRWTPTATPPKIRYEGRDYARGGTHEQLRPGQVVIGRTAGGGVIYDVPVKDRYASSLLQVRDGRRVVGYELMGGP
jgi:hypothetical protein